MLSLIQLSKENQHSVMEHIQGPNRPHAVFNSKTLNTELSARTTVPQNFIYPTLDLISKLSPSLRTYDRKDTMSGDLEDTESCVFTRCRQEVAAV